MDNKQLAECLKSTEYLKDLDIDKFISNVEREEALDGNEYDHEETVCCLMFELLSTDEQWDEWRLLKKVIFN